MKYRCLFFDLDDTIWDIKSNGKEINENFRSSTYL